MMPRASRFLERFLFEPSGPANLGFLRALFFGYTLVVYWGMDTAGWASVNPLFWQPVSLFRVLDVSIPPAAVLTVLDASWKVAMLLGCIGLFTRPATWVSFGLGAYLLGFAQNFGKISHRPGVLVLVLCVLALSKCGDAWSVDAWRRRSHAVPKSGEYTWPIRAVWVVMATAFFGAGVNKAFLGSGWFSSEGLRYVMIRHAYIMDADLPPWGLYIATVPWLCTFLAVSTVLVELAGVFALFSGVVRAVVIPGLCLLQLGNALMLGVHSDFPWLPVYAFWVPWNGLGLFLRARLPGLVPK